MSTITKAVFPVAGLGTRFLPATKAIPKEMLPIVDKPLIQYAVEEAITAGITELIFIIGMTKYAITEHFDRSPWLETELHAREKHHALKQITNIIPPNISCIYIRQSKPLGLGHAVLCAQAAICNQPFVLLLPDDLIKTEKANATEQLVAHYQKEKQSVIAVKKIARKQTSKYGIISPAKKHDDPLLQIDNIVEKPDPELAPSTLAVIGRYVFTPAIFSCLAQIQKGADNELQLTDAIGLLLSKEKVFAHPLEGTRYDCGEKLGYMQATIRYGLDDPQIKEGLLAELKNLL